MSPDEAKIGTVIQTKKTYRIAIPEKFWQGFGFGVIVSEPIPHKPIPHINPGNYLVVVEWANGHRSNISLSHLIPATKKELFAAKLKSKPVVRRGIER